MDGDLVTHGYIVVETLAVVRRRFGADGAVTVIDDVLPLVRLAPVDDDTFGDAMDAYRTALIGDVVRGSRDAGRHGPRVDRPPIRSRW